VELFSVRSFVRLVGSSAAAEQILLRGGDAHAVEVLEPRSGSASRGGCRRLQYGPFALAPNLAAACDGGSRSRSRGPRPCGGSPCTSRRSSSPKHGPSRHPPAGRNRSPAHERKFSFPLLRTPTAAVQRLGPPRNEGRRAFSSRVAGCQECSAAEGNFGPAALLFAAEHCHPGLHGRREQARPLVDQRLARRQGYAGPVADAAVLRLAAGRGGVADEHRRVAPVLHLDAPRLLFTFRAVAESFADAAGRERLRLERDRLRLGLARPPGSSRSARRTSVRLAPGGDQRVGLDELLEVAVGLGRAGAAVPLPARRTEAQHRQAAGFLRGGTRGKSSFPTVT